MRYNCLMCGFKSDRKTNFTIHMKSKKHAKQAKSKDVKENEKNKFDRNFTKNQVIA